MKHIDESLSLVLPRCLIDYTEWEPDERTWEEWRRFEVFYGRPLTVRERLMCLPADVLVGLARNGAFDILDVFLLKAAHARESVARLDLLSEVG